MKPGKVITWGDIVFFAFQALAEHPLTFLRHRTIKHELREIERALR